MEAVPYLCKKGDDQVMQCTRTNVQSNFVACGYKVLVRGLVVRLHMLAVGQRQVLLGQLEGQLLVAMPFAGRADLRNFILWQRVEVSLNLCLFGEWMDGCSSVCADAVVQINLKIPLTTS